MEEKPSRPERLFQSVKAILLSGQQVLVVGWKDSNHNQYTRKLAKAGRIRFIEEPESSAPLPRVRLVIFTKFVSHRDMEQVRTWAPKSMTLGMGLIKKVARRCVQTPGILPSKKEAAVMETTSSPKQKRRKRIKLDPSALSQLSNRFMAMVGPNGTLSRVKLANLVRKLWPEEPTPYRVVRALVRHNWLVVVKDKKAAGCYKPGKLMLEASPASFSPTQTVQSLEIDHPGMQKLIQLLAQEEQLNQEIKELEEELNRKKKRLGRIEELRVLLAEIEEEEQ